MRCLKCNQEISGYPKFCVNCGEAVMSEKRRGGFVVLMKKINLEATLKIVSILGIIVVSFSVCYFFVYRPIDSDLAYKKCFDEAMEDGGGSLSANENNKIKIDVCSRVSR